MIYPPEYLFVYGTLRSSFGGPMHRALARQAEPVGPAWIPGRLYDAGRYPAAVAPAEPEDRVRGEIHALPPGRTAEVLAELDRYEGYLPHAPDRSLFRRERVRAETETGQVFSAWVYLYIYTTGRCSISRGFVPATILLLWRLPPEIQALTPRGSVYTSRVGVRSPWPPRMFLQIRNDPE